MMRFPSFWAVWTETTVYHRAGESLLTVPRLLYSCYTESPRPWGHTSRGPSALWAIFWVSAPDLCMAEGKQEHTPPLEHGMTGGHNLNLRLENRYNSLSIPTVMEPEAAEGGM